MWKNKSFKLAVYKKKSLNRLIAFASQLTLKNSREREESSLAKY